MFMEATLDQRRFIARREKISVENMSQSGRTGNLSSSRRLQSGFHLVAFPEVELGNRVFWKSSGALI
jgi:hypothetical protein